MTIATDNDNEYAIGDLVEYQDSPGQWWPNYTIVGFYENDHNKYVSLQCGEATENRVPIKRVRKQAVKGTEREIEGSIFKIGDFVEVMNGNPEVGHRWEPGATIMGFVPSDPDVILVRRSGRSQLSSCHYKRLRRDKAATLALHRTEEHYRWECNIAWQARCRHLGLKPGTVARAKQLEAFLQCYLAMAVCTELMSMQRANQIQFLVAVGRGEEYLSGTTG